MLSANTKTFFKFIINMSIFNYIRQCNKCNILNIILMKEYIYIYISIIICAKFMLNIL